MIERKYPVTINSGSSYPSRASFSRKSHRGIISSFRTRVQSRCGVSVVHRVFLLSSLCTTTGHACTSRDETWRCILFALRCCSGYCVSMMNERGNRPALGSRKQVFEFAKHWYLHEILLERTRTHLCFSKYSFFLYTAYTVKRLSQSLR